MTFKKIIVESVYEINLIHNGAIYLKKPDLDKKFKANPIFGSNMKLMLPMLQNDNGDLIFSNGDYLKIEITTLSLKEAQDYLA